MKIRDQICQNCSTHFSSLIGHCPVCGTSSDNLTIQKKKYSDDFVIERKRKTIYVTYQDGISRTYENAKINVLKKWVQIFEEDGTQWIIPSTEIQFIKIKEENKNA